MSDPDKDGEDLRALMHEADAEIARTQARARALSRSGPKRRSRAWAVIPWAILIGVIAWRYETVLTLYVAPSARQVEQDLRSLLSAARDSIESARAAEGALPREIPDPVLGSLVEYTVAGDDYRLGVDVDGMAMRTDRSGQIEHRGPDTR